MIDWIEITDEDMPEFEVPVLLKDEFYPGVFGLGRLVDEDPRTSFYAILMEQAPVDWSPTHYFLLT